MTAPFERADTPKAERVIGAPVEAVYGAVAAIQDWSSWVDGVVPPVEQLGPDEYSVSRERDGQVITREVAVKTRGPTHLLALEVDDRWRLSFRTRPHPQGTQIEAVAEELRGSWPSWLFRGRRRRAYERKLDAVLEQLSSHFSSG